MTSKMIPIVHRIAILATKPMMSRINPRMSMLLAPPTLHRYADMRGELAERTVSVPTLECQPRLVCLALRASTFSRYVRFIGY
jgi:hypothetical protein